MTNDMPGKQIILNNQPVAFTCRNSKFQTDISNPRNPMFPGSVTFNPVYDDGSGQILLLEKVIDNNGNRNYWLMWYKYNGEPILTMSGVIDEDDIVQVIRNISEVKF